MESLQYFTFQIPRSNLWYFFIYGIIFYELSFMYLFIISFPNPSGNENFLERFFYA